MKTSVAFPPIPDLPRRLAWPMERVEMVLDTDTYNEIDDQFALVQALLSPERLQVEAVYAAPFHNQRSSGPAEGMEKSYEEIIRLLAFLEHPVEDFAFRGSAQWLPDADTPVESPAVADLISRARQPRNGLLYVVAIGAITNVASALLQAPDIADRIVICWLGGHPLDWPTAAEFNLRGDATASQVVFDSGAPLILFPCYTVAEALRATEAELEYWVRGHGPLADYLCDIFRDYELVDVKQPGASKVIWDLAPIGWLLDAAAATGNLVPSPRLTEDLKWLPGGPERHPILEIAQIKRHVVFSDLFRKLRARGK